MLVNMKELLADAEKNRYAVGLFNTINLEMARGVIAAAEETKSPVIVGTAEVLLPYASLEELSSLLIPMAKRASVPVVLHFDHGLTEERVLQAMDLGFTSIMYDCSKRSFRENIAGVAAMTKRAHSRGVTVEGELGHVGDNDHAEDDGSIYTSPADAREFAEETGVDALAIAIGTAHGAYKSAPRLDFNRLQEIHGAVSTPLVLHGGSGLSDDDFRKVIAGGITKVNIFTDINYAAAKAAYDGYLAGQGKGGFAQGMTGLCQGMTEAVKQETMKKMRLFGSCGRA